MFMGVGYIEGCGSCQSKMMVFKGIVNPTDIYGSWGTWLGATLKGESRKLIHELEKTTKESWPQLRRLAKDRSLSISTVNRVTNAPSLSRVGIHPHSISSIQTQFKGANLSWLELDKPSRLSFTSILE